jgi:hypothetical protein
MSLAGFHRRVHLFPSTRRNQENLVCLGCVVGLRKWLRLKTKVMPLLGTMPRSHRCVAQRYVKELCGRLQKQLQSFLDNCVRTGEKQAMKKNFDPAIGQATRWRKGQPSPNPAGRPKEKLLTDALREILAEPFPRDRKGRCYAEVIAWRLATEAAKGNLRAASEIADRTEGRAMKQNESQETDAIPDQASAYEQLRAVATRLRARLASDAATQTPWSAI